MDKSISIIAFKEDDEKRNIFELSHQDFRDIQKLVAELVGAQVRQDKDDSILLRIPNSFPKKDRNNIAKFLLHPEKSGTFSVEEISSLSRYLNSESDLEYEAAILEGKAEVMKRLTPIRWALFKHFVETSSDNHMIWTFEEN